MEILSLGQAPKVPINREGHILLNNRNVQLVHLMLKPGESIDPHVNEKDVIFYILEGEATFLSDNTEHHVSKDDCIKIEGGINRGFQNKSDSAFKLLVIKFID